MREHVLGWLDSYGSWMYRSRFKYGMLWMGILSRDRYGSGE